LTDIATLLTTFEREGVVDWLGTAATKGAPIVNSDGVMLVEALGVEGDRHAKRPGRRRQVTLIQAEHLVAVGAMLGRSPVAPERTRRNVVVSGINLWILQSCVFEIGEALLEGSGPCPPCERMEQNLGAGGYLAMRGHGGITARVLRGGRVRVGDAVRYVSGSGEPGGA